LKELDLRKLHRIVGVAVAPLLILQVLSGIFISVDWLMGIHRRAGEAIKENFSPLLRLWDMILVDIHYGPGMGGALYHIVLGIAAIWVVASGFMIFLRIRVRQKQV
jgi:succinate dehydrogenase/fumarate reductase cytochrome b subunit